MNKDFSDFSQRASDYDISRPRYEDLVIIISKYLDPDNLSSIADIGAGTGLLSEALNTTFPSAKLYSVEPCFDMFNILSNKASTKTNWLPLLANAEDMDIPENSIDLICCAQSFHFFNNQQSHFKLKKILASNGKIVLIWGVIDNKDNIVKNFHEILLKYTNNRNDTTSEPEFIIKENLHDFFEVPFNEIIHTSNICLNFQQLISLVFSFSYMPQRIEISSNILINELKTFFDMYSENNVLKLKIDFYTYISDKYE